MLVGCSEQVVENSDEALSWLGLGNSARITGATQMNEKSSRSHAIFTVHIRECGEDGLSGLFSHLFSHLLLFMMLK